MPTLLVVTMPNKDGDPKDTVKMSFAFDDASANPAIFTWCTDLFEHNFGTNALHGYIASCIDWPQATMDQYDLTGHLDGSPHGSPVASAGPGSFVPPGAPDMSGANQTAMVIGFQAAGYATAPTVTGSGEVPTPEQAQDYGAPATHIGNLKGKARQAGRIYFGPLAQSSIANDANNNPVVAGAILVDAAAAFTALKSGGANDHGLHWSVWSRRDAVLRHVTQGWMDHGVKTRRTREFVPNLRTAF